MKRFVAFTLCGIFALVAFAGCGGDNSSSASAPSSAPISNPASTTGCSSAPASGSAGGSSAVQSEYDLAAIAATLAEAAGLGTTIDVMERALTAGGINIENVVEYAGAESQLSAENGGLVIVIFAKAGTAATVAAELEGFRDKQAGNEDYAEFENARENIRQARIKTFGDYVVYAVSASGDWDGLDAAIEAAFA